MLDLDTFKAALKQKYPQGKKKDKNMGMFDNIAKTGIKGDGKKKKAVSIRGTKIYGSSDKNNKKEIKKSFATALSDKNKKKKIKKTSIEKLTESQLRKKIGNPLSVRIDPSVPLHRRSEERRKKLNKLIKNRKQ